MEIQWRKLKMTLQKILELDVLDKKQLSSLGYNPKVYYCGNHFLQKSWTQIRDFLEAEGVKFPFNPACFKHDHAYGTKPSLWNKFKIDWVFHKDMMKILDTLDVSKELRLRLKIRARIYFTIVLILTPVYIHWFKKNG